MVEVGSRPLGALFYEEALAAETLLSFDAAAAVEEVRSTAEKVFFYCVMPFLILILLPQ